MTETQKTINEWQKQNFPNATEEGILNHIGEEFIEFLSGFVSAFERLEEAADIVILLYAWAQVHGFDINKAVDAKMKKNRQRQWNIQPDGTGRHTK